MSYTDKIIKSNFKLTGASLLDMDNTWKALSIPLTDWDNYARPTLVGTYTVGGFLAEWISSTFTIGGVDGASSVQFCIGYTAENIEVATLSPVYTFTLDGSSFAQNIGTLLTCLDLTNTKSIEARFKLNAGTATLNNIELTYSPK